MALDVFTIPYDRQLIKNDFALVKAGMRTLSFPNRYPKLDVEYYGFCRCANDTDGNFYDFIGRQGGLAVSFGDLPNTNGVSAISISRMQAIVRAVATAVDNDLDELARELNQTLYFVGPQYLCAPWFYAVVDPVRYELHYVNAGHEPPLLIRPRRGATYRLERTGAALGLSTRNGHRRRTAAIEPGDILAIFSEEFSDAVVLDVVHSHPYASTKELTMHIWQDSRCVRAENGAFAAIRLLEKHGEPIRRAREAEIEMTCVA